MFGPLLPRSISGRGRSRNSGDSGSGSQTHTNIYGPTSLKDEFRLVQVKGWTTPVLAKIEKIYRRLKLDKELLDKGFCFGLLDPASNIIVNNAISKRASALKSIDERNINQRSLDGLIAFLTCLFPYLPDAEAVAYLDAAEADPLAAALLIINRRRLRRFGFNSGTTVAAVETALRCAAIAAKHPDPEQLVLGWKRVCVSPDITKFTYLPPSTGALVFRVQTAMEIDGTSDANLQLRESWELAKSRLGKKPIRGDLPPVRATMKRMLLTMIHGFYLQALARLPRPEMRNQYHRSMLMGGYCYGPLDPVSNIIVNTLLHKQIFPRRKEVTVCMISSKGLWRLVARSLYGLVSFMCTRYRNLTPDQAMERLLETGADLRFADPNLIPMSDATKRGETYEVTKRSVGASIPSASVAEAYAAAATAAHHPNPAAQQKLLGSPGMVQKLMSVSEVLRLQDVGCVPSHEAGCVLSHEKLYTLSLFVGHSVGESHQEEVPTELNKRIFASVSENRGMFWEQHERVSNMVEIALDAYNKDKVTKYKLHIICGVNELVSGPEFSHEKVGGYNPWTPFKYHHSHVNFLATCDGSKPATLFFAECGNDDAGTGWCLPVCPPHSDADQVRCIYCENEKSMIVHPTVKNFHGRNLEFEMVAHGEPFFLGSDEGDYANDEVIINKRVEVDWVHPVKDDCIYSLGFAYDGSNNDEEDTDDACDW